MKKKHAYTEMSNEKCRCGRGIKANVAERKTVRPLNCYHCYKGLRHDGFPDFEARTTKVLREYRLTRRDLIKERKARRKRLGI